MGGKSDTHLNRYYSFLEDNPGKRPRGRHRLTCMDVVLKETCVQNYVDLK